MKILVSGGTTFVSKFTAEYFLKRNNEVYVINRNSREQVLGVHLIESDRMNPSNLLKNEHFDLIIDVTAYNQEHIKSILNSGVIFDNYIFISSSAVYPETNIQPFNEEQACGQNSVWGDYGINKLMAEQYLINHCPDAYILRPPYFYGMYENLYREAFPFDCAEKGRKFYIPQNGDMKLQFYNVSDLCKFIELIIKKKPDNHIYNVGNSDIITVKEWVKLCYKAVGKIPEFVEVDKSVQQRDYFCFYDYEYILDVKKQNELMPTTIPLEVGLKEEYEWYKNNYNSVYNRKPYIEFIDKNLK
ncbi:nucleoside-diphosphate-sugar epimerases [Eubacterium sp. CAG:202]|nr:nucleoside-diphosphate-sugar epimerases [Eubacterium sp. CAG:202]